MIFRQGIMHEVHIVEINCAIFTVYLLFFVVHYLLGILHLAELVQVCCRMRLAICLFNRMSKA